MRHTRTVGKRALRPSPALIIAFIALFVAMGGFGYAAVKLKPNSVGTKTIKDGAVTTSKLASNSIAPSAANAINAARLGGAAPGQCQTGWLKGSLAVNTATINPDEVNVVPGFDCASKADDAVTIHREAVGQYTVTFADNDTDVAIASSAGANAVTAATPLEDGSFLVKVWNNGDAAFVDGKTFTLIAY